MRRIYFATSNKNKFNEASRILEKYGYELVLFSFEKRELQSTDLGEIALQSALIAYTYVNAPVVVEDSGLFIKALNGFPGPFSSYVYKTIGVRGVLKLMEGVTDRSAYFEAAVAIVMPPFERVFKGSVYGRIADSPRGTGGFGFDPIFIPENEDRTFAEMSVEEKNRYSHRARAFEKLGIWLKSIELREKPMQKELI
ncbi:MAG: XTP/dITP diphosphatase [Desulfurococcales archaeon]|jgi:XTP/dITP diphosphohydrolase|nr:XTP/dITP diphosphatase [Desulfurococcales archaeon]